LNIEGPIKTRQCARQYVLRYPDRQCPNHTTIMRLINRAREDKLRRKRKKKSLIWC